MHARKIPAIAPPIATDRSERSRFFPAETSAPPLRAVLAISVIDE
jgi:hypothetical protein